MKVLILECEQETIGILPTPVEQSFIPMELGFSGTGFGGGISGI